MEDSLFQSCNQQPQEKCYVLFEIGERKIKILSSIKEKGKLRILKLKDLKSKQEYEIEDFLKVLKRGSECIMTINSGVKVIQGFNELNGSEVAINKVLRGNYLQSILCQNYFTLDDSKYQLTYTTVIAQK